MSLLQLIAILAISTILLPLGIRAALWRHVLRRRLRVPRIEIVRPTALPHSLDPVFEAAERTLSPMGFEMSGARWVQSVYTCEGRRPERVYLHPESRALAFVAPPLPGMGERPYMVRFVSRLADDSVLATFDGISHLTPGFPPAWECHDHDVNDLGKQWALHLHALEPRGGLAAAADVSLEAWTDHEVDVLAATLADWAQAGLTRSTRPARAGPAGERWRFRVGPAWDLTTRLFQGQRRVLAAEAQTNRERANQQLWRDNMAPVTDALEPDLDEARAAAMAWGYAYERSARRRRRRRRSVRHKWWVGVSSGLACLSLFGWWVGWELAWILIAVLLIHELGHLAAMEAFGCRDRRILFLPFIGAATLGEKVDASPGQRTLVYLLGPAPGILLGLAALYGFLHGGDPWWLAAATTALLVNYLNLLPISPLDGGRVVETLLLGRFPRAQVAFLGVGALAFATGAWLLRDPILAGIALALLISLRTAWLAAGALVRARRRVDGAASEAAKLRAVFALLQEPPYSASSASRRLRLAGVVIPRLEQDPASLRTALAGGLVYVTMLIGVPIAVTGSVYTFAPDMWESLSGGVVVEADVPPRGSGVLASAERDDDGSDLPETGAHEGDGAPGQTADQSRRASMSEASLVGR